MITFLCRVASCDDLHTFCLINLLHHLLCPTAGFHSRPLVCLLTDVRKCPSEAKKLNTVFHVEAIIGDTSVPLPYY